MKQELVSEQFMLSFETTDSIRDADFDTYMTVSVQSKGFSAVVDYVINLEDISWFANKLCDIYERLVGDATLEAADGDNLSITFEAKSCGHIQISGYLIDSVSGQELDFYSELDQSYLRTFCYELKEAYGKY